MKSQTFIFESYENAQLFHTAWINRKEEILPISPDFLLWCCGEERIKQKYIRRDPASNQPHFYWSFEFIVSGTGKLIWHGEDYELKPGSVLIYHLYGAGMEFRPAEGQELRKFYFGIASNPMLEYLCRVPSGDGLDVVRIGNSFERLKHLIEKIFKLVQSDSEYQRSDISMLLYGCITLINQERMMFDKMDDFSRMVFAIEHAAYRYKNVDMLVKEFKIPRRRIFWLFKKKLNSSPMDFIIRAKIELSCRYLIYQTASIDMIAKQFGYKSHAFYTRTFKKIMNMTPSEYREMNRTKNV